MDQPDLLAWQPPPSARFNGATYDSAFDQARLKGQIKRVHDAMIDGHWRTLGEIEQMTGDPQASISAQLRNLKKRDFGSHQLEKRARGERTFGLWEYKLLPPEKAAA